MRRRFPITLALVALLAVAGGLASCDSVSQMLMQNRPDISVAGVQIDGLSVDAANLLFDLEVTNQYQLPLPYAGIDWALSSGGREFLSGVSSDQGVIPVGESRIIPLAARVPFTQMLQVLSEIRPGGLVPYTADIGLKVDAPGVGPLRLPVRSDGEIPVPAVPRMSFRDIQWESLSLFDVSGLLNVQIDNLNEFPIDLDTLSYALKLADVPVVSSSITQPLSFAAGGSNLLQIPLSFKASDLGTALLGMLSGSGGQVDLAGTLKALSPFGILNLPFQSSGYAPFKK